MPNQNKEVVVVENMVLLVFKWFDSKIFMIVLKTLSLFFVWEGGMDALVFLHFIPAEGEVVAVSDLCFQTLYTIFKDLLEIPSLFFLMSSKG